MQFAFIQIHEITTDMNRTSSFMMALCLLVYFFQLVSLSAQPQVSRANINPIKEFNKVFLPKTVYRSGQENWDLTTADMNKDGYADIISASKLDGKVTIHLNDGDGGFKNKQSFVGQPNNRAICTMDANGDGWPDIATVTILGRLNVMLNDKRGGLIRGPYLRISPMAHHIEALDFNNDGKEDLLVTELNSNSIRLFYGDGTGKFPSVQKLVSVYRPRVAQLGDLNNDKHLDLIVGGDGEKVHVFFNLGNNTFGGHKQLRSGTSTWGLGLADFDRDGDLDIAAAAYENKLLCIYLNDGNGAFGREQCIVSGDHNFDMVIRDFDMDGDLDIANCSTIDNQISVHFNDGKGTFGEQNKIDSGKWNAGIASADFDNDGDWDIATASIKDHLINVHMNQYVQHQALRTRAPMLTGTVYNEDTKQPIGRTTITLMTIEGRQVSAKLTEEDGSYQFTPKVGRTYNIIVRAVDLPVKKVQIEMPNEDMEKDIYLGFIKDGFVYGKIRDKNTGKPLPGATVNLGQSGSVPMFTLSADDQGNYRQKLPLGLDYQAEASFPKYTSSSKYFDIKKRHAEKGRRVDIDLLVDPKEYTACYEGVVMNEQSGEIIPNANVVVSDLFGAIVAKASANEVGKYNVRLPFGDYKLEARAKGYFFHYEDFSFTLADKGDCAEKNITLTPLEEGLAIILKNIYYDVDKADLRTESEEELDRLVEIMNNNPTLTIEIGGHTDSDGSDPYNEDLSQRRSQSVINYLMEAGIDPNRMKAKGYGEAEPIAPNDTAANKQLNRRTEFKVVSH